MLVVVHDQLCLMTLCCYRSPKLSFKDQQEFVLDGASWEKMAVSPAENKNLYWKEHPGKQNNTAESGLFFRAILSHTYFYLTGKGYPSENL